MEIEDVFRAYQRAVFAYFLRVVGDRHEAEELTQETFVRACEAIVRFRRDAAVSTWLFGIARRVLLEASRRGLFDRPRSVAEVDAQVDPPDHDVRLDLEAAFAELEPVDREAAFAELEPVDREVLMLVDFLGFGSGEAAGILGIEAGAFRMRCIALEAGCAHDWRNHD